MIWMRRRGRRPVPGALRIPPAGGKHYADDHPWDDKKQRAVSARFLRIIRDCEGSS